MNQIEVKTEFLETRNPKCLLGQGSNLDQIFKDSDGQTVEYYLKQLEPEVKSVRKDFLCKKQDIKLEMTIVNLGNILVIESNFVQDNTKVPQ